MRIKLLLLIFVLLHSASVFAEALEVENGFAETITDPKTVQISIVDQQTAFALFDAFLKESSIPFNVFDRGCYARATAMARFAEQRGVEMGKRFIEGNLHVKIPGLSLIRFGWHVAPVLFVKSATGIVQAMVFDPTYFLTPVSLNVWEDKFVHSSLETSSTVHKAYFGSRFQYGYLGMVYSVTVPILEDKAWMYDGRKERIKSFRESNKNNWFTPDLDETAQILNLPLKSTP